MATPAKTELGIFYTTGNPFTHPRVAVWLQEHPVGSRWLEPFAGANNIVRMVQAVVPGSSWTSYDIVPGDPSVIKRDTIQHFPTGFDIVVTNPPYLARNSARRRGLVSAIEAMGEWSDLYLAALAKCLDNTDHVAAIIPESFIARGELHGRLRFVVSLNEKMFDDTEHPVCIAVFGPDTDDDFEIWVGCERVGRWMDLNDDIVPATERLPMQFNATAGRIGLRAVDGTDTASIRFVPGRDIDRSEIKHSSRHRTRIHVPSLARWPVADIEAVIAVANEELEQWRERTGDVMLSPFMGLRRDGVYRRRLDFDTAGRLLSIAITRVVSGSQHKPAKRTR